MITKRRKITPAIIRRFLSQDSFQKRYLILSVAVLATTTIIWALMGSWIQAGNADQLANSYLLENSDTFNGAVFADQHSFLFKLPFFWLIQLLGGSLAAFSFVTVLMVCLTVGLFAFILYKLQPRPLIIGTIFLALSVVLLMIPAEPYSNSLLPTNMAMLTTRNLEYVLFIGAILLVIRTHKWLSWRLILAFCLMILLVASDKLFLSLGIGGALLFATIVIIRRRAGLRVMALRWVTVTGLGSVGALLLLHFLTGAGILHLDGHFVTSPYAIIDSFKNVVFAVFYAITGIFTNFGANPAYDSRTIVDFATLAFTRLLSPVSYAYLGTVFVGAVSMVAIWKHIHRIIKQKVTRATVYTDSFLAALILVATSIAAVGAFAVTTHYYPVDSRYLAIILFAGFVALAAIPFKKRLPVIRLVSTGALLIVTLLPALLFPLYNLQSYRDVSHDTNERNIAVSKTLSQHSVDTLLGNYWRVFPIKSLSEKPQTITPLSDCTTLRTTLTSRTWDLSLKDHSFAYLLTLGENGLNFPTCSLDTITDTYGRPDSSVVISGTPKHPKELLLFYDSGIHKTRRVNIERRSPDTVVPITLEDVPFRICEGGRNTVINFVAHEDDDILFMNPDLSHSIQAGNCVRTVFLTAGDAGTDAPYWLGRQKGTEAAYATMLGNLSVTWTERVVEIIPGHFATIANPRGNRNISLVFLHLPDGNMNGKGFPRSEGQSLARLYGSQVASLQTIEKQSYYSGTDVQNTLTELLKAYLPNEVRSQSVAAGSGKYTDHSDHTAVGHYVSQVVAAYIASKPMIVPGITYYLGYPIHGMPENVSGADLDMKVKVFLEFSKFDNATCRTLADCDRASAYGAYLRRQYTSAN